MPDDPTDLDPQAQPPPGEHRLVWRGDVPVMAETDAYGVVRVHPVHTVPDGVWDMPFWRLCALPDWASSIDDPSQQMAVLVTELASRQLDAIDELRAIRAQINSTRLLIGHGVTQALIDRQLVKLLDAVKALTRTLDP